MRKLFIGSLILLLVHYSCTKEKKVGDCPTTCGSVGALAYFAGYTPEEIDTVIVKIYKHNGLFDTVVNVDTISDTTSQITFGQVAGLSKVHLSPRTDYEIFVPATLQTFRISMAYASTIHTFPCDRNRTCQEPFAGATITGGLSRYYSTSPGSAYIELSK